MEIAVTQTVPFPRAQVFAALRDVLPDLAAYMPNVDRIEPESREEPGPGEVKLVNRWFPAETEIPKVARPFIDADRLHWIDYAHWNEADWSCRWHFKMGFMAERVEVGGLNFYHEHREGAEVRTEIRIGGDLRLNLKGLLPGLIARRAAPKVEAFVVKLVRPNFERFAEAVTGYLRAQSAGG